MDLQQEFSKLEIEDKNDELIHVFFPKRLPQAYYEEPGLHQKLIQLMIETLTQFKSNCGLDLSVTTKLFKEWTQFETGSSLSGAIQKQLKGIKGKEMMCLYIEQQNSGLIFSGIEGNEEHLLVSAFQASPDC